MGAGCLDGGPRIVAALVRVGLEGGRKKPFKSAY